MFQLPVFYPLSKTQLLFQVADYFWVEPEPEPVIEESETERSEVPSELLAAREAAAKIEAMRSQQDKAKDQVEITRRLSMPVKPKQISKCSLRLLYFSLQQLTLVDDSRTTAVLPQKILKLNRKEKLTPLCCQ